MIQNAKFVESCLTNTVFGKLAQHGFDCTVKTIKYFDEAGKILRDKTLLPNYKECLLFDGCYILEKGVYSITFNEGCNIPKGYCGWFHSRSSLTRNGCFIQSGIFDNGFITENMGATLFVYNTIQIEHNARIAQFIMIKAEDSELYNGQWQKERDIK